MTFLRQNSIHLRFQLLRLSFSRSKISRSKLIPVGYGTVSGNYVKILGPNWRIQYYAHMKKSNVRLLQFVRKVEKIGEVGKLRSSRESSYGRPSNNPSNSRRVEAIELAKTATASCHCRCGYDALVPCMDHVSHYKVETLESFDHKLDRATRRIGERARARTEDETDVGSLQ